MEDPIPQLKICIFWRILIRSEYLESLVEFRCFQTLTLVKRPLGNRSERHRKLYALEPGLQEGLETNLLETFRELHTFEILTLVESVFLDSL